jgi:hypothetical protein
MEKHDARIQRLLAALFIWTLLSGCAAGAPQWSIHNPYASIDWENHQRHKANFHTHTTMSDGTETPETVIGLYAQLGYSILALTDHDTIGPGKNRNPPAAHQTTWPWTAFNQNPDDLGMVAVEGNEISRPHHMGSYFNDYGDARVTSEEIALSEIGRCGGLAVLFHPGRYDKPVQWYVDRYRFHPHLIGLEIYNQGDRYPGDRKTWDAILTDIIHERPVWGFSNDDMHQPAEHLGRNFNVLWLPTLSTETVRQAMENGMFFYVYRSDAAPGEPTPEITSIMVDARRGTIGLQTSACRRIEWVSAGKVVHQGASIQLSKIAGIDAYVRAVAYGSDGKSLTGTQPFRIQLQTKSNP